MPDSDAKRVHDRNCVSWHGPSNPCDCGVTDDAERDREEPPFRCFSCDALHERDDHTNDECDWHAGYECDCECWDGMARWTGSIEAADG